MDPVEPPRQVIKHKKAHTRWAFLFDGTPRGNHVHRADRLRLLCLRLSTGRGRRDKTGDAALPRFELPAVLELDRLAHDSLLAFGKRREVLPHDREGHAHLPDDLQVEALSVL